LEVVVMVEVVVVVSVVVVVAVEVVAALLSNFFRILRSSANDLHVNGIGASASTGF
jgi:hypothetical protein